MDDGRPSLFFLQFLFVTCVSLLPPRMQPCVPTPDASSLLPLFRKELYLKPKVSLGSSRRVQAVFLISSVLMRAQTLSAP